MVTIALTAFVLMSVVAAADATTYAENAKLTASDAAAHRRFGEVVAVSGDVVVVGVRHDGDRTDYPDAGAAYVFRRSGERWIEEAKLTASERAAWDRFGGSVAVAGDTVAVSAAHEGSSVVYVFGRSGEGWMEQARLTASDGEAGDGFGGPLALTGDTLAVGATNADDNGQGSGAVYVFTRSDSVWAEDAKLTASDGAPLDFFGGSLAIGPDILAVGASSDVDEGEDAGSEAPGAVYVFTPSAAGWTETAKLVASDGAALDEFGYSVGIAGDSVVASSLYDDHGEVGSGSVYVFDRVGEGWVETAKLGPPNATAFEFGISLAAAGDTIVVGTHESSRGGDLPGSAYVFTRSSDGWAEVARLAASDGVGGDVFGSTVVMDGDTAVIGAPSDDGIALSSGSAYVFELSSPVIAARSPVVDADFDFGDTFPSGAVTLTGAVDDDAPVRWVRVAIRDRLTRLWLQDDMVTWGRFNRFPAVLADPTAAATAWSFEVDLPDGTYALSVRTKDRDGNAANIRPWRRFNVGDDVTAPTIDADFDFGAQFESPVRLTGTAGDDRQVVRVRVAIRDRVSRLWLQDDGVTWGRFNRFAATLSDPGMSSTAWSFEVDLPPGDYSLSARATDLLGNESSIRPWRHFSIEE